MKNRLTVAIVAASLCATACAHSGGGSGGVDGLSEQQRVDLEALRTEFVEQIRALRDEVGALRTEAEQVRQQHRGLLARLEARAAPEIPSPDRPQGPDPATVYSVPVDGAPMKGSEDAWVTIVEFSDFQCPYCKRANPTLDELRKDYGDDLRVAFRHNPLPFHEQALPAAIASMCAHEQRLFWPMHDALFENYRDLAGKQIASYARNLDNLNFSKWKACVDQARPKEAIVTDQQLAARLGARGTPAFFINGRFLSGAQPAANFARIIDEELKKAKDSGMPPGSYYLKAVVEKGRQGP